MEHSTQPTAIYNDSTRHSWCSIFKNLSFSKADSDHSHNLWEFESLSDVGISVSVNAHAVFADVVVVITVLNYGISGTINAHS